MANDRIVRVGSPSPHPLGHPDGYAPRPPAALPAPRPVRGPWDNQARGRVESPRRSLLRDLAAFLRLLRAWAEGRYARFPARSAVLLAAAALYVLSPIDVIPDFIPFLGVLDDATVVALVLRALRKDVAPFVDWESMHA